MLLSTFKAERCVGGNCKTIYSSVECLEEIREGHLCYGRRRRVFKEEVEIYGILEFTCFRDLCYANYITLSTVKYLGIPQVPKRYPYIMKGY